MSIRIGAEDGKAPYRTPAGETFVGSNTKKLTLTQSGAKTSGQVFAWANPEGQAILITRAILEITTRNAASAATLDIGVAADGTTSADNLIDGASIAAAVAIYDNINDAGSNGKARQRMTSSQYITGSVASGDADGVVANLYITYNLTAPD